jgi:hypothetical protein
MAMTLTPNALLQKPATADRYWDVPLNANADFLDGVAAIGQLLVTPTEVPSTTLNVRVTGGSYVTANGTVTAFPGVASYAIPPSSSVALWLTDSGVLSSSASFPASPHVRVAIVATGPSSIQTVTDARVVLRTAATSSGTVGAITGTTSGGGGSPPSPGETVSGPLSVVTPTGMAVFMVDPVGPGVAFFGATPAAQAPALPPLTDATTGVVSDVLADVGSTFSQAQIDSNFAVLAAKLNAVIVALKRHGLMAS